MNKDCESDLTNPYIGITEDLKTCDPIAWVGATNNIHTCAEEMIYAELV